jgi:Zn-dependent alcohol dehydrogenase
MATEVRAAVLNEMGGELELASLDLADPGPGQVRVRLVASGVCRSDLHTGSGIWGDIPVPMVLGHEGAGVIEEVGAGVDQARIGEHVVLTFSAGCGTCRSCIAGRPNLCLSFLDSFFGGCLADGSIKLSRNGEPVYHMSGLSTFATHVVVMNRSAIAVGDDVDLTAACLLGCGATTGVLSVVKRGGVRPGQSVAIFGCGGVGLAALLGARLVGAAPIVAVDPVPAKRALALELGASVAVDPSAREQILELTDGGVDFAFEASGTARAATDAITWLARRGTLVLIGQPAVRDQLSASVFDIAEYELSIIGSNMGSVNPSLDIPALSGLMTGGKLPLERLITNRVPLDEINDAFALLESAEGGGRSVVIY